MSGGLGDLQLAKIELKVAQATLAALQARQHAGEMIDRKTFDGRAFGFFRGVRDRMQGMGARHAALLASRYDRDPGEVALLIEGKLAEVALTLSQSAEEPVYANALRPDPRLTVSEWADQHRVLSSRGSAEAGPYRTSRTPYLKEIMDSLSARSTVRRVVFMKAAQIGATECANCWVGYVLDQVPGPILAVQPTVELAKRFSKQRIDPMIEDSPRLSERVSPARTRDSGNTVLMKEFPGGVLVMTGANSAVGLRSMPARYLLLDEVDAYPGDVGDEGDPVTLAEARTRTFSYLAKTFLISTPRLKGTSVITREYERSDQRRYFVPCPYCGTDQVLVFDRLRYDKETISTVHYQCEHCDEMIAEHHKTDMLERGHWQATKQGDDPHMRGYHLSALYSPVGWLSWLTIVRQWENEASKSIDARKGFINTILGEAYEEEANPVPEWERLYERRESWPHGTVPARGLFLTAGVDVQGDRIEVDVWAWGRQLESWLVEHLSILGDPGHATTWSGMTALLGRTWEHASGRRMSLQRVAVDTGAYTQSVYQWARTQDRGVVIPVKGVPRYDRIVPVAGPTRVEVTQNGTKLKGGLNLWTVAVSFFKSEFYKQLILARPTDEERAAGLRYPAGYVHIPDAASDEWVKQLVSEQQVVVRKRTGFQSHTEWRQLRPRNEALDMRIYARAAVWLAQADRWAESKWRDLEEQLGLEPEAAARVEQRNVAQPVAQSPVIHPPVSEAPPRAPGAPGPEVGGMIRPRTGSRRRISS